MSDPNLIISYVNNTMVSYEFYSIILRKAPIEASPTFAMFGLESGMMLGLSSRHSVAPAVVASPGASELAFALSDRAAVDDRFHDWTGRGLRIVQTPTAMDFGYTFVALDPDGHRLRVFAPAAGAAA